MKMKTQNDTIGNLFRDAFENYEKQPSEGVWANIQAQVNAPMPPKAGIPRKVWYFSAGGAAILAVTALLYFSSTNENASPQNTLPLLESPAEVITPEAETEVLPGTAIPNRPTHSSRQNTAVANNAATSVDAGSPVMAETKTKNSMGQPMNEIKGKPTTSVQNQTSATAETTEIQRIKEVTTQTYYTKGTPAIADKLSLPADKIICNGEDVLLNAGGGKSYYWNTGEMTEAIRVMPQTTTFYSLTLTTQDNTEHIHHVKVEVKECASLYIPDAFSPNGDGSNDEFITYGANISQFSMKILSPNGQLMFETNDINQGWNGRFKGGDAPGDVYFYVVNFTDIQGQQYTRQGRLFLLR
jgi:gliding motility-associated-like protein